MSFKYVIRSVIYTIIISQTILSIAIACRFNENAGSIWFCHQLWHIDILGVCVRTLKYVWAIDFDLQIMMVLSTMLYIYDKVNILINNSLHDLMIRYIIHCLTHLVFWNHTLYGILDENVMLFPLNYNV